MSPSDQKKIKQVIAVLQDLIKEKDANQEVTVRDDRSLYRTSILTLLDDEPKSSKQMRKELSVPKNKTNVFAWGIVDLLGESPLRLTPEICVVKEGRERVYGLIRHRKK